MFPSLLQSITSTLRIMVFCHQVINLPCIPLALINNHLTLFRRLCLILSEARFLLSPEVCQSIEADFLPIKKINVFTPLVAVATIKFRPRFRVASLLIEDSSYFFVCTLPAAIIREQLRSEKIQYIHNCVT